jgi:hypothetical protein
MTFSHVTRVNDDDEHRRDVIEWRRRFPDIVETVGRSSEKTYTHIECKYAIRHKNHVVWDLHKRASIIVYCSSYNNSFKSKQSEVVEINAIHHNITPFHSLFPIDLS